ncbi:MAG: PD40 domain-containing protein [Muribaculaceae bacterium]|nr:PD40 domain-containing protein [Muribaculaceae bacterium]
MKKIILLSCGLLLMTASCSKKLNMTEAYMPEERTLNVMKITDENSKTVGINIGGLKVGKPALSSMGVNKSSKIQWDPYRRLAVSPDGAELAYLTYEGKNIDDNTIFNIMIRNSSKGAPTQRTFRNIRSLSWGNDGRLYSSDFSDGKYFQLVSVDSHVGNLVRQLTSNNNDHDPILSNDGRMLFFERLDKSGPSIWSYDLKTSALTVCAAGFNPCPVGDGHDMFVCVRNNTAGYSELWLINYTLGQETLILSDKEHSFTNPDVSPDGEWIVCQGNTTSSIKKRKNLDIFAVRIDGSGLIQLTHHPAHDCCPVFSKDGNYVYFISTRTNKDDLWNIWRMNFTTF